MPVLIQKLSRLGCYGGLALTAIVIAGCAQQQNPNYYAVEHDTTASDAQQQAQGPASARAPSQIQLAFGDQRRKPNEQPPTPQAAAQASVREATRPLMQAKTFLGTVPCLDNAGGCSANRITLTIAPTGEWRARTVMLGPDASPHGKTSEQGCWSVIGIKPLRILLQLKNENPKASLTFINDNVLHIDSVNGIEPNLNYRLTRQADIDAINELHGQPALKCPAQAQAL